MIGFFDSGFGGLAILKEVEKVLPEFSFLYFGDNARAPYGSRSPEEIFNFTLQGVEFLFSRGAQIVILVCNTSSSSALRKIQQEVLPSKYPNKKVLGIIIPTTEDIARYTQTKEIGILATEATVQSEAYKKEILKIDSALKVFQQACPLLVPMIEAGEVGREINFVLQKYLDDLFDQSQNIDAVILGCTHYALIEENIKKLLPAEIKVVSQGHVVAEKLKDYLVRHQEITGQLSKDSRREFLTSGEVDKVGKLGSVFYGQDIFFQKADF